MIVQNISTNGCPQTIVIGRRGTYDTMQIAFDLSYLIESYGSGTAVLAVKRSQDESAYPAVVTQEDSTLLWTVNETDTAYVGSGECQLMWYVEGGLAKTIIYPMVVMRDILSTAEEPPDGYENWIEHLTELGAETQQNAQAAAQSATEAETAQGKAEDAQHAAEAAQDAAEEAATKAEEASAHAPIIVNGYWYSWDATTEAYQNTNVKAEGRDGTDGFSPAITVTDITGGHRVTITDADGTHTIDVMNGTNGTDGDDGFSPTVTITTITGGHRVTITDKNGAHSFDVMDGEDGASDAGEVTYDKTATYQSGTVGAELADLSRQLSDVESSIIKGTFKIPEKYSGWPVPELTWVQSGTRLYAYNIDVSMFKAVKYSLPSNFQLAVKTYTVDGEQIKDTGWDTSAINYRLFGGANTATFLLRHPDNSSISVSDVTNDFKFYFYGHKMYNYNDGPVYAVYHRGCSDSAPENTEAAFLAAAKEHALFVETDVRYTSDGVAVILHDTSINRTARNADGTALSSTVNIADITYEEALTYDYGIFKGESFKGQKILTADEFFEICAKYQFHPIIELKVGTPTQASELYQSALHHGLKGNISFLASDWTRLASLTAIDNAVDYYWSSSFDSGHIAEAAGKKTSTNRIHVAVLTTAMTSGTQELINTAINSGVEVAVWTIPNEEWYYSNSSKTGITHFFANGYDASVAMFLK